LIQRIFKLFQAQIKAPWICCQIGAREDYAVPRALHQSKQLLSLITDAWVLPDSPINYLPFAAIKPLKERFHPELSSANVQAITFDLGRFELIQKTFKSNSWQRTIARNQWFQKKALVQLSKIAKEINDTITSGTSRPTLFAYSYAALDLLRFAKEQGWQTILGQIDPGIVEEQIMKAEYERYPIYRNAWNPAPESYWENWREECSLADKILVNSSWSAKALQKAGINTEKIRIIPLAYEPSISPSNCQRTYPLTFNYDRPLKALFLGQVILRKGIMALLEAAQYLQDQPIEFWFVGQSEINFAHINQPNIHWIGSVPRSEVSRYYQEADVFLFPTLSDGFGLTQLEAQTWKLPLIVSSFCGEVVQDNINGLILPEVTGNTLAEKLLFCLENPDYLNQLSQHAKDPSRFNLARLRTSLQSL